MTTTTKTKFFSRGDHVVIAESAHALFLPNRIHVIHEVLDVVRGGYTIAPLKGEGVDHERSIGAMFDEVRAAGSAPARA